MTPAAQHTAVHQLTMRLQSLSLSLHQHRFDGAELVEELKRVAAASLGIAEELTLMAMRLEDDLGEEVPDAEDERIQDAAE